MKALRRLAFLMLGRVAWRLLQKRIMRSLRG